MSTEATAHGRTAEAPLATRALGTLARAVRGVHWYVKELVGENGYHHYLAAYERRHGTRADAMTEREYWRDVTDRQDREPTSRCC
ncbi:YbdD/YjiX family protein [Brevibacterium samyangense]|uniref:YbdD/YjiX family protein n=1 Tax=Brevibacterium samyangense TaxID=366888 RepID=UPI0031D966FE